MSAVQRMSHALMHRGPDDTGLVTLEAEGGTPRGAFAHRRLAIIDLSALGHQPMYSSDGSICITYNGEIYNYEALRAELIAEGISFRSTCDTEVLLAGWQRHGTPFLERLRGMFAFALWDARTERGVLARDAFGIKPLYVSERAGEVLFASEVRAFMASGRIDPMLSSAAVATYLATGSVTEPLTILEGVYAVPPGCVVEVEHRNNTFVRHQPKRFITAYPADEDIHRDPRSHIYRVRNALRESVRYHLVSDVPVALFLSGGIDSSAVAGLASEVSTQQLESFTVTFSESDFSEAGPAREAARRFNTKHHEIFLSSRDLLNALPDVFAAMDQPSLDGLNTFVVSRAVRAFGIKVVLSGLGGDELFAGYPSFRRAQMIEPLWNLPSAVRRAGATGARAFGDPRADRVHTMLEEETPAYASYRASRTLFGDRNLTALTGTRVANSAHATRFPDDVEVERLSLMQQVSLYELTGYMRNTLLRDSDVFSMAHALELRVPLVDLEVARAARAAAGSVRLSRAALKPVLVEAVRDLLSPETLGNPKRGFTLPLETWMRHEMRGEVDSVMANVSAESIGLRGPVVKEIWGQFLQRRPGVNWSRPWALYTLMRWAQEHGLAELVKRTPAPGAPALTAMG